MPPLPPPTGFGPVDALNARLGRFFENVTRVHNLIRIYGDLYGKGRGRRSVHSADILRAAVVLLHACLEDFLRDLAVVRLPEADENVLNEVPMVGASSHSRPEKFFLGRLASHRGKTVDDVIEESVRQHLERSNFNSIEEVVTLLKAIGVDPKGASETFPRLRDMMLRRHQIVHRADRVEERGRGKHVAKSISVTAVRSWADAVGTFATTVMGDLTVMEMRELEAFLAAPSA